MADIPEFLIKDISRFLAMRYGGLDYWWLSKPWKQKHHQDTARIIIRTIQDANKYYDELSKG